jgi:ribosomal protein S18 acetylase RimI-like enzyme
MEIIFSDIDEDDLVGCSELYVATFRDSPWNEEWSTEDAFERLSDFLASPKSIAVKAIHNGNICGFLLGQLQQWNGATFYYLKEICVSYALQRRGIGKSLMGKLEEILTENGVSRIYLITQRDSVPSGFYSSLGFSENQNVMVMGKQVEKSS